MLHLRAAYFIPKDWEYTLRLTFAEGSVELDHETVAKWLERENAVWVGEDLAKYCEFPINNQPICKQPEVVAAARRFVEIAKDPPPKTMRIPVGKSLEIANQALAAVQELKQLLAKQPRDRYGRWTRAGAGSLPQAISRLATAEEFHRLRSKVSYRAAYLSEYSLDDLKQMAKEGAQFRISKDGSAGYILHQGELKNLFCLRKGTGIGKALVADAISRGAERLDCLGLGLASMYAKFGFKAVRADKWDDQYAPRNWDYQRDDRPDVFYMEYRGGTRNLSEIRQRYESDYYPQLAHPGYGE